MVQPLPFFARKTRELTNKTTDLTNPCRLQTMTDLAIYHLDPFGMSIGEHRMATRAEYLTHPLTQSTQSPGQPAKTEPPT